MESCQEILTPICVATMGVMGIILPVAGLATKEAGTMGWICILYVRGRFIRAWRHGLNLTRFYCVWIAALLGLIRENWEGWTWFVKYGMTTQLHDRMKVANYS